MNTMFSYNLSQALDMAKLHQAAILREFQQSELVRDALAAQATDEQATRRFFRLYRLRHWLYRLAPRMARAML